MTARQGGVRRAWGARVVSACAATALFTGLVAPHAAADDLNSLKNQVKANQESQGAAQENVAQSRQAVNSATDRLITSQNDLQAAQASLADVEVRLAAAQENDARLAQELKQARADLEAAKARVATAQAEVDAQVKLIGSAARESFQQQSDLRDLSVVWGSQTPAELSQRLQWNTTIFDSQAATKGRLDAVRDELEAARAAQADAEARVADERDAAAAVVRQVASLKRQQEQQRSAVAELVTANAQAQAAAQGELDADESAYRSLVSDEARLQGEIKSEIARLRAEEAARVAAEKAAAQRAAEQKAAAERAAAARQAAAKAVSAPAPAAAPAAKPAAAPSSSGAGKALSASGFIRPINANPGSPFGPRFHPILKYWRNHNGNDWGAKTGTPIYAAKAGTVMKAGPNGGFGNFVMIGHGDDAQGRYVTTGYAHMSKVVARVGQRVEQGQLIGYVGSTGLSTTPHLHLEVRLDGTPVNPLLYIP